VFVVIAMAAVFAWRLGDTLDGRRVAGITGAVFGIIFLAADGLLLAGVPAGVVVAITGTVAMTGVVVVGRAIG
jgi:drug/metabolite transporter (DMT)-like permease